METTELVLSEGLKKEVATLEEMTKTVAVRNADERTIVYQMVQSVKSKKKMIVNFFADSKQKANAAWKAIVSMEKTETDKLDAFEFAGKAAILKYDQAKEKMRLAEQRRLQAIADETARKEREKREQEAAKQRQIEEESRKKADEARKRAQEAQDQSERERLQREAEAADRKANAAQIKADSKLEDAAAVVAPIVQMAAPEKQKGESTRDVWTYEVLDVNMIPREYLQPNEKALAGVARATKGSITIPGIRIFAEKTLAVKK